ncbi:MAG TPA: hypothetical protein PLU72_18105 [Candidatus Ozemobacteraceae bacterium]|nr:hypothetical protein [Candidatus Ozemobacteraceae bacterium]HQG28908.1 hypothetical protein [Candidatus Ozemobacteraceae bacterium]
MQISSRFPTPQELLKQLEESLSQGDPRPAEAGITPPAAPPVSDIYEGSAPAAESAEATDEAGQAKPDGLRISYHFDLFYQLSQKVQTRMGQSGQDKFIETTGTVAETFRGNFSLEIDAIGNFMKGTDAALNVSNETANEFFDAVNGLAELSPDALENFLKESGEFFDELEQTYGEAGGAFDEIKARMQAQAKAFFKGVSAIRGDAAGEAGEAETAPAVPETAEPAEAASPEIKLAVGPQKGLGIREDIYRKFIDSFLEYIRRYSETLHDAKSGGAKPAEQPAAVADTPAVAKPAELNASPAIQKPAAPDTPYPILPNMPNGKFPIGYYLATVKTTSVFSRFDFNAEQPETAAGTSKLDTSA